MRAFLLHAVATLAVPLSQWPFSWDTLPTFAFPGAAPRFMTAAEEAYFSEIAGRNTSPPHKNRTPPTQTRP